MLLAGKLANHWLKQMWKKMYQAGIHALINAPLKCKNALSLDNL